MNQLLVKINSTLLISYTLKVSILFKYPEFQNILKNVYKVKNYFSI